MPGSPSIIYNIQHLLLFIILYSSLFFCSTKVPFMFMILPPLFGILKTLSEWECVWDQKGGTDNWDLLSTTPRHFGSYQQSKLSVVQGQGRCSALKSSWTGQYKKGVQYDFQFTSEYSGPPAIQGGEDYMVNRLDQVDREMEKCLERIDRYQGRVTTLDFVLKKTLYFLFNK